MQQQLLTDILAKRRDRVIAIILGVKERECDKFLNPQASSKLRKVVLDQVNDYHDLCCDLIRSLDTDEVVLNEIFVDRLDMISNQLTQVQAEVASAYNCG
jgi:hypothetical protein